jgi:hypothetical protein
MKPKDKRYLLIPFPESKYLDKVVEDKVTRYLLISLKEYQAQLDKLKIELHKVKGEVLRIKYNKEYEQKKR